MQQCPEVTDELVEQMNRRLAPAAIVARLERPGRGRRLHLVWFRPNRAREIRRASVMAIARDMGLVGR